MQKKPKSYSATLMDQIPIKYLICQAQGLHQELGGEMIIYNCSKICFWLCDNITFLKYEKKKSEYFLNFRCPAF